MDGTIREFLFAYSSSGSFALITLQQWKKKLVFHINVLWTLVILYLVCDPAGLISNLCSSFANKVYIRILLWRCRKYNVLQSQSRPARKARRTNPRRNERIRIAIAKHSTVNVTRCCFIALFTILLFTSFRKVQPAANKLINIIMK